MPIPRGTPTPSGTTSPGCSSSTRRPGRGAASRDGNHRPTGSRAWGADGFRVRKTFGYGHGRYGILASNSTHSSISRNIEMGAGRGTAGISVSDSDDSYTYVASNDVEDYNLGIFVREARVVRHREQLRDGELRRHPDLRRRRHGGPRREPERRGRGLGGQCEQVGTQQPVLPRRHRGGGGLPARLRHGHVGRERRPREHLGERDHRQPAGRGSRGSSTSPPVA